MDINVCLFRFHTAMCSRSQVCTETQNRIQEGTIVGTNLCVLRPLEVKGKGIRNAGTGSR
jgi:hypothetical protein